MEALTYGIFGIFVIAAFLIGKGMKGKSDNSETTNEIKEMIKESQDTVKSSITNEIRERNNDSRDTIVTILKAIGEEQQKVQKALEKNNRNTCLLSVKISLSFRNQTKRNWTRCVMLLMKNCKLRLRNESESLQTSQ